jgi:predicted PurR-regulated permease PerM
MLTQPESEEQTFSSYTRRVWVAVMVFVSVAVFLLVLWQLAQVLLVVFAGILLAVFFRGLTRPLAERTGLSEGISLMIVILTIILVLTGAGFLLAPGIADQMSDLAQTLPEAFDSMVEWMAGTTWGAWMLDRTPSVEELAEREGLMSNFFGFFSTALGAVANLLFLLVLAVYLAATPSIYWKGIVLMVPVKRRDRAREIVLTIGDKLWYWLTGQFVMMIAVGTLTTVGLLIAGVPLPFALGLLAGLFEFVPIVGPIAAAVPGVLIAIAYDPMVGLYAAGIYLLVQQIESNLLTPLVMRRVVSLPPALTLSATVIATVLFGLPGLLLATPLALVVIILVRMVYVNDILGDDVEPVPEYKKGRGKRLGRSKKKGDGD